MCAVPCTENRIPYWKVGRAVRDLRFPLLIIVLSVTCLVIVVGQMVKMSPHLQEKYTYSAFPINDKPVIDFVHSQFLRFLSIDSESHRHS